METNPKGSLAVIVRFTIVPAMVDRFLDLVMANARTSKQVEPGCQRFDVLRSQTDEGVVMLYELYQTPADFADHLSRLHYRDFDNGSRVMILEKVIERLSVIS